MAQYGHSLWNSPGTHNAKEKIFFFNPLERDKAFLQWKIPKTGNNTAQIIKWNTQTSLSQIWFAFLGNLPVPMHFIHITTFPLQCIKISSIFASRILHYHPQLFNVPRASKCFMITYNWLLLQLSPVSYTHTCVEWENIQWDHPFQTFSS